jgi:hypothetical protein
VPQHVDQRVDARIRLGRQPNQTPAEEAALEHFSRQRPALAFEANPCPLAQLLTRVNEGVPQLSAWAAFVDASPSEQQTLDRTAGGQAPSEQARGEHARVVHDEQIARPQMAGERVYCTVPHAPAGALEDHQPRLAARRGSLRDELLGQIEVELGDEHRGRMLTLQYNLAGPFGGARARAEAPRRAPDAGQERQAEPTNGVFERLRGRGRIR